MSECFYEKYLCFLDAINYVCEFLSEENKMKRIFLILTLLAVSSFAIAGDLNPPAAPGSTMKTLGEVEPRIPLGQADFPVSIHQSGSYYLTENVTISTASNAFYIAADDVSIDLMGFTITGTSNSSCGVSIGSQKNISISNGTFDGFGYSGIYCPYNTAQNIHIENVVAENCAKAGIYILANENSVENCRVLNCGTNRAYACGIAVGSQSRVVNCLVEGCGENSSGTTVYAITGNSSSQIVGNIVKGNFGSSSADHIYMIKGIDGSIVKDNIVVQNGINANTQHFYTIFVSDGSSCVGNSVFENASGISSVYTAYGIFADNCCVVKGNTVHGNFSNPSTTYFCGLSAIDSCLIDSNAIYSNTGTNLYTLNGCVLGTNVAP